MIRTNYKHIFTFCLLCLLHYSAQSQDTSFTSCNTIYVSFATEDPYYSVNYDRVFTKKAITKKSYRIGFAVYGNILALPLGINFFTGKKNDHFEYSLTVIPYVENYQKLFSPGNLSDKKAYVIPAIGYRYQKPTGGFFFKINAGPYLYLDPPSDNFWNMDVRLYIGASVGAGISF